MVTLTKHNDECPSYKILSPDSFKSMLWKNGLGHTLELLKQNLSDSEGFAWRISMADVTEDGDFSYFNGYDRTLVLLEGKGISLNCEGQCFELSQPLQAAVFKGDDATYARLHDGPIKDFNVMTERSHYTATVLAQANCDDMSFEVKAETWLVYCVLGELLVQTAWLEDVIIPHQHLLVVTDPEVGSVNLRGGDFISVQIKSAVG